MQTILYVDDHADSLELGRALLGATRRRVICAGTGREGLTLAQERKPDLILLDLHLRDVGGLVVLQRLKEDVETQAIPVIVLSTQSIEDTPALQGGLVAAYVRKPVDPPVFSASPSGFSLIGLSVLLCGVLQAAWGQTAGLGVAPHATPIGLGQQEIRPTRTHDAYVVMARLS